MVKKIAVALQGRDQLTQGLHPGKLRMDQRHELRPEAQAAVPIAAATGLHKPLKTMAWNRFQKRVADRILMLHDLGSNAVSTTRKVVETNRIQVMRRVHKYSYRTVVGVTR